MYPRIGQFDGVMGPDGEGPGLKPSTAVSNDSSASPVTAAQSNTAATDAIGKNRMSQASYGGGTSGAAKPTKATKPIDKSNWNRSIKVSQGMVDEVKKMGMGEAAKYSKMNAGAYQAGLVGEMNEATKRVYPSAYTNPTNTEGSTSKSGGKSGATFGGSTGGKSGATFGGTLPKSPGAGEAATFGNSIKGKSNKTLGGK